MQNPLHLLLVEDDPDDVDLLESSLRDNGIEFQSAVVTQGDQVLNYLQLCKNFPNIIVLDLNLPKMHGKEVLAQIKNADRLKQIPVVILTTSSAQADREFCLEKGAADYLIKPVTIDGFQHIVERIASIARQ